jgi:hypothetical protein
MGEMDDLIILFNVVFFIFLISGIVSLAYLADVLLNLKRKKIKPEKRRRTIILSAVAAAYFLTYAGFSTYFLVRCYSLPVIVNHGSFIRFDGNEYGLLPRGSARNVDGLDLVLIGRDEMVNESRTPGVWAAAVIVTPSYYMRRGDTERRFIYYDDAGEWLVFELREFY